MYKSRLSFFITLFLIYTTARAQTSSAIQPASIGFDFVLNDYRSFTTAGPKRNERPYNPVAGVAISFTKGISGRYSWAAKLAGSFTDSITMQPQLYEKQMLIESSVSLRRMLVNHSSLLQPFLSIGIGGACHHDMLGCFIPAGAGIEVRISESIFTALQAEYRAGIGSPLSSHLFYGIGIAGVIPTGARKSTLPSSGVVPIPHRADRESQSTADRDHDGIIDDEDECPDQPGHLDNRGCPATPDTARMEVAVAAIAPSIANESDSTEKRTLDSLASHFRLLANKLFFETNSYTIATASFSYLDEIADALLDHPNIYILIVGHTDDLGTAENNLVLSRKRAEAVGKYLEGRGVVAERLTAEGRGESQPVMPNRDARSRAVNRRVELNVRSF